MKKLHQLPALFAIALLFIPFRGYSTTPLGGNITWRSLGNDSFEVNIKFITDCNGISPSAAPLNVKPSCASAYTVANNGLVSTKDITPVCKSNPCTRCTNSSCSFNFGVKEITYKYIVGLSAISCCDFTLYFDICCRTAAISTGVSGTNLYVESKLNKCMAHHIDNSPSTNPPIYIYCKDQCATSDMAAYDLDGDSLSYSLVRPLASAANSVVFNSGYDYDKPLKFGALTGTPSYDSANCLGFAINPVNGQIRFKPTKDDYSLLAVKVTEWRKDSSGKYNPIGSVMQETGITVIDCSPNKVPLVNTSNKQTEFIFCAGTEKCITFKSSDPDNDSTYLSWDKRLAPWGATFTSTTGTGKLFEEAKFCWTPQAKDTSALPYFLNVMASDSKCPIPGRTSINIKIMVKPAPNAKHFASTDSCGWVNFKATRIGKESGTYAYTWAGKAAVHNGRVDSLKGATSPYAYKYTAGGNYKYIFTVKNTANGCMVSDTDSVKVKDFLTVTATKDTLVCAAAPLILSATVQNSTGATSYKWSNGATSNNISVVLTKNTAYRVEVRDANGCYNYDSVHIKIHTPLKPLSANYAHSCAGQPVVINTKVQKLQSIAWYKMGLKTDSFLSADTQIAVLDSGIYKIVTKDSMGCKAKDSELVQFNPPIDVKKQNLDGCRGRPLTIDAGKGGPAVTFKWYDISKGKPVLLYTGKYYTIPNVNSLKILQVIGSDSVKGLSCFDVDTIYVTPRNLPVISLSAIAPQCINGGKLNLSSYGNVPAKDTGKWSYPQNPVAIKNNTLDLAMTHTGNNKLIYTLINEYGCAVNDSLNLKVNPLPVIKLGYDTTLCPGAVLKLHAPDSASNVWQDGSKQDTFIVSKAGLYRLISKNTCGAVKDSIHVYYIDRIKKVKKLDTTVCIGISLDYTQQGCRFFWNDSITWPKRDLYIDGLYTLKVYNDCEAVIDTVKLNTDSLLDFKLGNDTTICFGASFYMHGPIANSYTWQDGSNKPTYHVKEEGTYTLIASNTCGSHKESIRVYYYQQNALKLLHDVEICENDTFGVYPYIGPGKYLWNDSSTTPRKIISKEGVYSLSYTDPCLNIQRDTMNVTVSHNCGCKMYIPNAFAVDNPGPGRYKIWKPVSCAHYNSYHLQIFNRWGEKIFETDDINKGWSGSYNGKNFYSDTYIYKIVVTDVNNKETTYTGTFNKLR